MNPITSISAPALAPIAKPATPVPSGAPGEFQNLLTASIQSVETERAHSQEAVEKFLSGETDDIHKVALATQRAELSSDLFMQVRNKVVSAYQEVMKMQM